MNIEALIFVVFAKKFSQLCIHVRRCFSQKYPKTKMFLSTLVWQVAIFDSDYKLPVSV
jgi:hypothetical protein